MIRWLRSLHPQGYSNHIAQKTLPDFHFWIGTIAQGLGLTGDPIDLLHTEAAGCSPHGMLTFRQGIGVRRAAVIDEIQSVSGAIHAGL